MAARHRSCQIEQSGQAMTTPWILVSAIGVLAGVIGALTRLSAPFTIILILVLGLVAPAKTSREDSRSALIRGGLGIAGGILAITAVIGALALLSNHPLALFSAATIVCIIAGSLRLLKNRPVPRERSTHVQNAPIISDGLEFFPNRQALAAVRPIKQHIKGAEAVWALWNVGTQASANDVVGTHRVKRLLLPDPNSRQLIIPLAQALRRDPEAVGWQIRQLTNQALEFGVVVRWFRCSVANTFTIGNPEKRRAGWVHFEALVPFIGANERPSFRIYESDFPALFAALIKAYDHIWRSDVLSVVPNDSPGQFRVGSEVRNNE
jgi:hypothetical protein